MAEMRMLKMDVWGKTRREIGLGMDKFVRW